MSEITAGAPTPPADEDLDDHLIRVSGDDGSESARPSGVVGDVVPGPGRPEGRAARRGT